MTIYREIYHLINAELNRFNAMGWEAIKRKLDKCGQEGGIFGEDTAARVNKACEAFAENQKWPDDMDGRMVVEIVSRLVEASAVAEFVCAPGFDDLKGCAAAALEPSEVTRTWALRFLLNDWWSGAGVYRRLYESENTPRWPCARSDSKN